MCNFIRLKGGLEMYEWHVLDTNDATITTFISEDSKRVKGFMTNLGCTDVELVAEIKEKGKSKGKLRGILNSKRGEKEEYVLGYLQVAL